MRMIYKNNNNKKKKGNNKYNIEYDKQAQDDIWHCKNCQSDWVWLVRNT